MVCLALESFFPFAIYWKTEGVAVKMKAKEPSVPLAMQETFRREIFSALTERPHSAKELSSEIRLSEKEIYDHLEHVRKSMNKSARQLIVTPAECKKCGFVFSKRERLKKPGRCPVCRGEAIYEPLFSIENK